MIFDLVQDFSAAVSAIPKDHTRRRILTLLDEAIRRDVHFIVRHPTTFFQCMWNTCWWYDCAEAAKHYHHPETGTSTQELPWKQPGPKLNILLGNWRRTKERLQSGFPWLRSIRPPVVPLGTGMRAVLRGHQQGVTGLACSEVASRIASGSSDGVVRVWDSLTMSCGNDFRCPGGVETLSFSPDGTSVAAGCHDGTLVVWQVDSNTVLLNLRGHMRTVNGVSFSPDGKRLVSAGADGTLRMWDITSGAECGRVNAHDGTVSAVAFSPRGGLIVSGSVYGELKCWDVTDDHSFTLAREVSISVTSLAFSPDGNYIACGSADHTVKILQVSDGQILKCLEGHRAHVNCVAWSSDGYVISGSDDVTARAWHMPNGEAVACFQGHEDEVLSIAIQRDQVVTGSSDMTLRVWCLEHTSSQRKLLADQAAYSCHGFVPGSSHVFTLAGDGTLRLWDAHDGQCLKVNRVTYRNELDLDLIARQIVQQFTASTIVTQRQWKTFEENREMVVRPYEGGEAVAWFPQVFDRRVGHPAEAIWACTTVNWAGFVPSHLYLLALEGNPVK